MSPDYTLSRYPSLSLGIYLTCYLSHYSSCAAGQYDLCGSPKATAFWYRMQWLTTIPDGPDKTGTGESVVSMSVSLTIFVSRYASVFVCLPLYTVSPVSCSLHNLPHFCLIVSHSVSSDMPCLAAPLSLTITCTCCYDEIKGTQDPKPYPHAHPLNLSHYPSLCLSVS